MAVTNNDLQAAAHAVKHAEANLQDARDRRDQLIREALNEGEMTAAHISRQVGLSREMIGKLRAT